MINKIGFTGKAYFLDNVSKKINPEHKKRIENYAHRLCNDTDVVVFGQEKEEKYIYQGTVYSKDKVALDIDSDEIKLKISTQKGIEKVPTSEVECRKTPIPIYNAYILEDYNKEDIDIMPYRKQFDFTKNTTNTLIRPNNGLEEDDIDY